MNVKKQKKILIVTSVFLALLIAISVSQQTQKKQYKHLYSTDETTKMVGEHKVKEIKKDEQIIIRHHPKTQHQTLNRLIEEKQDQLVSSTAKESKQDYEIKSIHERFISVNLFNEDDGIEGLKETIQFDVIEDGPVKLDSLLNDKAIRYLTYLNIDKNQILLHENDIEVGSHLITESELPNYLKIDYGNIKVGSPETIPSVYIEHTIDPNKKLVAITFDDGPHQSNTQRIMNISEQYDAQVTFFVLGLNINRYPELIKMILDEGHQLASHTYNHKNLSEVSHEEVSYQISHTNDLLNRTSGIEENWMIRPPYGAYNKNVLNNFPYVYVNWTVDTQDWLHKDPQRICNAMVDAAFDGAIILLHDLYETSVDGFECGIKKLSEQGYQMVTVKDMFKAKGIELVPGQLYRGATK